MLTLSIISAALLWGFIALSVGKFGVPTSYSETYYLWNEVVKINHSGVFCLASGIAGALLVPVMIQRGAGDVAQCMGFFAPAFLIIVAALPDYNGYYKWHHTIAAVISAIGTVCWQIFVCHVWWPMAVAAVAAILLMVATKTWKKSLVFWAEMAAFASTFIVLLFGL